MNKAFTLVELAIVMTIIGLLIGGVLKGQEMIRQARIVSTMNDLKGYQAAVTTFQDLYAALPGDMRTATTRIPGCTAAIQCLNGNADGILSSISSPWYNHVLSTLNMERVQFWKHLALAGLASGVNPSVIADEEVDWGKALPKSAAVTGGLMATTAGPYDDPTLATKMSGLILFSRWNKSGSFNSDAGESYNSVSALAARQMDIKMDDGVTTSGDFQSVSRNFREGCSYPLFGGADATGYKMTSRVLVCDIGYRLK